jgi:uncharacterized membrane protein YciS (DUF1049 family)
MADGGMSANPSVIVAAISAVGVVIAAFLPGYMALKAQREREQAERDAALDHERRSQVERRSSPPVYHADNHHRKHITDD